MKTNRLQSVSLVLVLAFCTVFFPQQMVFAQQKVTSQNENETSLRKNESRVNHEFTDDGFVKISENESIQKERLVRQNPTEIRENRFSPNETGTFNLETETGTGTGWSWATPVLTILDGADVTITGQVDQPDNHTRIMIATNATAHITLSDVSITTGEYVSGDFEDPIYLNNGVTLTITLEGDNFLDAGDYVPAISATTGRTLIIDGTGSLTAQAGWSCAAIGGGLWDNGPCGTITINGGIIKAKGDLSSWIGTAGAGIGGGAAEPSGNITINGGVVSAFSGDDSGMGIGSGGGNEVGTLTITGNSIVFTNIAGDMNPNNKTGGILVVRNVTFWYADDTFTLDYDVTVPNTNLLTIEEGKTLTIPAGKTLINNGTIVNYSQIIINGTLQNNGTIFNVNSGSITGTVSGTQPTNTTPLGNTIDLSQGTGSVVGEKWVLANNVYTVLDGADVVITGSNSSQRRVEVAAHSSSDILLNNASVKSLGNNQPAFLINVGATVNMTIEGDNFLQAGRSKAGLQIIEGTTLFVDGDGSLEVIGGTYGGAAIGGDFRNNCGTITVNKGTIIATGVESGSYFGGAAIGGGGAGIVFFSFAGIGGWGGDVTINGGVVIANGSPTGAAGIGGGGESHNGGTLTMSSDGVVFTSSLETYNGTQTNTNGVVSGIIFNDMIGTFYGSAVSITDDVVIPEYHTLTIPAGATLTIPYEKTLENNGTITNNGTIMVCGTFIGTVEGNQPTDCDYTEKFTVTFNVFDAETEEPITDAVIVFDGKELEGYIVEIEEGTYFYSVEHDDYYPVNDFITIFSHRTIDVPLSPKVGIDNFETDYVMLYPNPFQNEINIINEHLIKNIEIRNILGQQVKYESTHKKTISTGDLERGIYFVVVEKISGEKTILKMVK